MIGRPIAWLAVLQFFAALLGHAGGLLGESWCRKMAEEDYCPSITAFYAHSGLWLLFVPLVWLGAFMVSQNSARSEPRLSLWVLSGTILLVGLGVTGVSALLAALPRVIH